MLIKHKPMLCPPVPWQSYRRGGHLSINCDVVRISYGSKEQFQLLQAADEYAARNNGLGGTQEVCRLGFRIHFKTAHILEESSERETRF